MRPATLIATLALAAALPGVAAAAPSACPEHHPGGLAPDILRPTQAERARELCFRSYAVLHSGVSRTALAAAEHLTRERVQAARGLERENAFHEEERLPPEARAHLADYARSGLDRGHMAPSGDMPTPEAQAESFSLANMVPQDPGSNRCLWEGIESAVRDLAMREGEVFVLTGPIFRGQTLRQLNGRVLVPTDLFKAVYVPSRGEAAAYVTPNAPGLDWRAVPLSELGELAGLNVFPALPPEVKKRMLRLPEPRPHNVGGACGRMVATAPAAPSRPPPSPAPAPSGGGQGGGSWMTVTLVATALAAVVLAALLYRVLGRR
jgi:endonuclease G, mitochondrial